MLTVDGAQWSVVGEGSVIEPGLVVKGSLGRSRSKEYVQSSEVLFRCVVWQ